MICALSLARRFSERLTVDDAGASGAAWTWGFAKSRRSPQSGRGTFAEPSAPATSVSHYYLNSTSGNKNAGWSPKTSKNYQYTQKTPQNLLRRLLQRPHLRITAIRCQQLSMRAALQNTPGVHHQNLVCVHHRGQAVRNHQCGLVLSHALQLCLNRALVGGVQRRSSEGGLAKIRQPEFENPAGGAEVGRDTAVGGAGKSGPCVQRGRWLVKTRGRNRCAVCLAPTNLVSASCDFVYVVN